jgi:hypothetical protein
VNRVYSLRFNQDMHCLRTSLRVLSRHIPHESKGCHEGVEDNATLGMANIQPQSRWARSQNWLGR